MEQHYIFRTTALYKAEQARRKIRLPRPVLSNEEGRLYAVGSGLAATARVARTGKDYEGFTQEIRTI